VAGAGCAAFAHLRRIGGAGGPWRVAPSAQTDEQAADGRDGQGGLTMILQVFLTIAMLTIVVTFLAWPIINGVDERAVDAERAELEDAKQSKYREIKDAELDHKSGRLTEEQWLATDRELRREAMLILARIDTLGAEDKSQAGEQPSPG
jgi:hypothetical protein